MEGTLFELLQTQDKLPMHMPGHKRSVLLAPYLRGLGAALDMTEIDGLDNLHRPEGILRESMRLAAGLYGAAASFYLVGGSTVGILAGTRALTRPRDKVILQRESHLAVHNAVALCQLNPVYLYPARLPDSGITGSLSPEALSDVIARHPDARLLIITCPSYEGVLSDLPALTAMARAAGLHVLVDAAHGAHLGLSGLFPAGAVASGADIVVQSLHKTLPSLTQTAIAHARDQDASARLAEQLDVFQTSSPSYLLLASMDGCVRLLREQGNELFSRWRAMIDRFREETGDLRYLRVFNGRDALVFDYDPGKLVVICRDVNINGFRLMARLRDEYQIALEMAQDGYVLAMTGMGDREGSLLRFSRALHALDRGLAPAKHAAYPPDIHPRMVYPPHEALLREAQNVSLALCHGRVCAEYLSVYPPGAPLLVPGERIDEEAFDRLRTSTLLKSRNKGDPDKISVLV